MGHAAAGVEAKTGDGAGLASERAYLRAVVAASECLVAETSLERGLNAALRTLREHTGLDRVFVFRDVPGSAGVVLYGESLGPGVPSVRDLFGDRIHRDEEFPQVIPPLRVGEIYRSTRSERTGENAVYNEALATRSDLMVPVFAEGRFWGIVGFDDCHRERNWSQAEIAALKGAASAIAAAVLREKALAERQRDNARHEGLLRAASEASAHLAAEADLQTGLQRALNALRQHTGADRVFLNRYAEAEKATYFWLESRHDDLVPFVAGFGPGPWHDEVFAYVTGPLLQGRVYRSLATQRSGENARRNEVTGSLSDLIVPILVDGRYQACLGFDDNHCARVWHDADVAVLQTVAAAIASAMQRDAATRAREGERQRYEALLRAVAEASKHLLAAPSLDAGLDLAMAALGRHARPSRAYTWQLSPDQQTCTLVAEWDAPGIAKIARPAGTAGLAVAHCTEVWTPLLAGLDYQSITAAESDAGSDLDSTVDVRGDVMVPIFVGGRCWGCIGFDNCDEERTYSSAEIDVLRGAASTISAAVARHASLDATARDAAALALRGRLLSAVAEGLQTLLGDTARGFEEGIHAALAALGRACGIHRVKVILERTDPTSGEPAHYLDHEWWADGMVSQASLGLTQFPNGLIEDWVRRMRSGQAVWYLIDDVPIQLRAAFARVGVLSVGSVPVFGAGRYLGLVAFDDCVSRRNWSTAEIDALTAAARTIGGAIHRHALQQAMLAERDRGLQLERLRAEDAEAANAQLRRRDALLEAVAHMSRELLRAGDWTRALPEAFRRLGEAAGLGSIALYREAEDGTGLPSHRVMAHWCARGDTEPAAVELAARPGATYKDIIASLHAGQAVWHTAAGLEGAAPRACPSRAGVSSGCVPLMVQEHYWGAICFGCAEPRAWGSAETDALAAVANAVAAAIGRRQAEDAQLSAERLRADDALLVNRLLEGVVAASRALLEDDDFDGALRSWLGFLGPAVDADRAVYGDFTGLTSEGAIAKAHFEWSKGEPMSQPEVPATSDFVAWAERLSRGESIWAHRDQLRDPESVRFWGLMSIWTSLIVPVVVDRCTVGWLCFDFQTRREWKPALGSVLRTAADGAAAAIKRQWAVRAMLDERDRRLAVEQARADESARHAARTERHAALLAAVAASAEELLATRDPGQRLDAVLARVGTVTQALRACVARIDWLPGDPLLHGWQEIVHQWSASGATRHMDGSLRRFAMPRADATWQRAIEQFTAERRIVAVIAEQDEPFRAEQSALGVVWGLCYPILIEGGIWGLLGIDYATRFEDYDEADLAALQALASTIADALSRQRLEQRTLDIERSRAAALRQANDELIASTSRLAALKDIPGFLDQLLLSMTRSCGARTGALFATVDKSHSIRMRRCVMDGAVVSIDTDDRMRLWRQPLPDWLSKAWHERWGSEVLIRSPLAGADSPDEWADNTRWHAQFGHRLRLRLPLNVGGELLGIIVLSLVSDDAPGEFQLQQAVVLAQQAAIALQMERLARLVEGSAVRTERERMAAEIHDSLAQSFTSIAMQSESLAGLLADDQDKSRVLRLIERTAREGLAEARMSVLALLPADGWPGSLDQSLAALAERSSIRGGIQCRFESKGNPGAMPGPVQESLLRIAQEATSNAMRHSGGTQVLIHLDYGPLRLRLTVEDDGRGMSSAEGQRQNGGFGVAGMESRAATIGGTLALATSALGGLAVMVDVPCIGTGGATT